VPPRRGQAVSAATQRTPTPYFWTYAFIDPGSTTGIVGLSVAVDMMEPSTVHAGWRKTARWVGAARVAGSGSTKLTGAEQDARLFDRVRDALVALHPAVCVIEEPVDALPQWGQQGGQGKQRHSERGTIFSLGRNYGLCLAAARALGYDCRIYTYQVNGRREKVDAKGATRAERPGWMPKERGRPIPRERLLTILRADVESFRDRPADGRLVPRALRGDLSDHELMAFGVGSYHLDRVTRGV
jgi:hypothetical protein